MKFSMIFLIVAGLFTACQHFSLDTNSADRLDADRESDTVYISYLSVEVDKSRYASGDTIRVTLRNDSAEPVYLDGCSQFYLASKADSIWQLQPFVVCVWEGFAVEVAPNSRLQQSFPARDHRGVFRIAAPVYTICQPGKPISQAECNDREVLFSSEFMIE